VTFREPPDSTAGRALRRIGVRDRDKGRGRFVRHGAYCQPPGVPGSAPAELMRRAGVDHEDAFAALVDGRIYADSSTLLPLVTGFHSWRDAADTGHALPSGLENACRAWFPGAGDVLPWRTRTRATVLRVGDRKALGACIPMRLRFVKACSILGGMAPGATWGGAGRRHAKNPLPASCIGADEPCVAADHAQ